MVNMGVYDTCTINLTYRCNLRCDFCYAKQTGYLESAVMKYEDLIKVVDFCNEAHVQNVLFIGGEPTLYKGLFDILEYIKRQEYMFTPALATNGLLLSDLQYCQKLVDSGIKYIDISLKGKDSDECYELTGKDCFCQQINAIRNLSLMPVEFTCSMVLTMANINSFCDSVKNAFENGARQFSFTFVIDNDCRDEDQETYLKAHNPFDLITAFFAQVDRLNSITQEWWIEYSFPICIYTDQQLNILKGRLAAPCNIHFDRGISFDTNLNLIPCDMLFKEKIGKLGEDFLNYSGFEHFTHSPIYRSTIERLKQYPSPECNSCPHLSICYGGCPVLWQNLSYELIKNMKNEYYKN